MSLSFIFPRCRIDGGNFFYFAVAISAFNIFLLLLSAGPAVAILGGSTVTSAIAIGVAAGGVGALNKLREYKVEKRGGKVILIRK